LPVEAKKKRKNRRTNIKMPLNIPILHKIEAIKTETDELKTFKFHSPEIARESEPGQFVMVWSPGIDEIPISIAAATPEGEVVARR